MVADPVVIAELRDLLPKPSKEEKAALKAKIKEEGQIEELVAWKRPDNTMVLIEGHTRREIMKDLGIKPKYRFMEFENIDAVKEWMFQNALARRNLPPQWVQYIIGKEYLEARKKPGMNAEPAGERSSAAIARKHQVSERTVRRAAKVAEAIDQRAGGSAAKKAEILAKRKARAKKSTAFNSRLFEATFGKLTRGVDSFARHCDITNSNAHRHLNRLLKDFWEAWEKVVEETKEKVTA
jgi:hypothetical protein